MVDVVEVSNTPPIVVELNTAFPVQNVFISSEEPQVAGTALWIQTNAGADGQGIDIKVQV